MESNKNQNLREQEASGITPGTSFQTPDSLPGENMDMMSLAGPGRKKEKKKKKSIIEKVSSFKDFLKNKS